MMDVIFSGILFAANIMVAWLNLIAWDESRELRDAWASAAWGGSTCYWLVRMVVAMAAL